MSCCFLAVDLLYNENDQSLPTQLLVSDIISAVMGFWLCLVGFLGKKESEDTFLQERLLNGTSASNGTESKKSSGGEIVCPCTKANLFSILSFSWVGHLIGVGNKKALDLADVPQLDCVDNVKGAFPIFRSKLESDSGSGSRINTFKLVKALIFATKWEVLLTAFLALIYTLASYVGPYLIDSFVQYLNGNRAFKHQGYVLVSAFFFAKLIECLSQRHWFFRLQQAGIRARAVLVAMIYYKGLSISCQSKQGQTSGEIINLMSVDAQRVSDFSWYMHDVWMAIVQVGLALLILYKNLGLASIAALVTTVVMMVANVPLGRLQEKFQEKIMKSKDTRMKATSEILRNMRILKLQAWEMKFLSKVTEIRKTETGWLRKFGNTGALTSFVFWGAPSFVSGATFGACLLLEIPLESGKILSALATFRILQEPIYNLPDTISIIAQTKVSLDRIASFLRLDDLQSDVVEKLPIGSGKSSLLSCILGEVPKISGTIKLCGAKAYVAQSPWIQSGKIEENILFGKEMDRERYEKILEACSLKKDLEILSFGDQTVIGERGINLSGGQKQRIQIARALYQDAYIYLFDDPFSAVDAHTGSHLFKECLLGLLGAKTVIYVTHQVEFLPAADLILVLKDGRITQAGKFNDILNSGSDFMELVGAHKEALLALDSTVAGSISDKSTIEEENGSTCGVQKSMKKGEAENGQNVTNDIVGQKGQLVQEEERAKGRVGLSVYWKYITIAYGGALVPFILLSQVLFQILQIGSNYWMAWATPVSKEVKPPVGGSTIIIVYVALAIGSAFCILSRALFLTTAGYKTATILFNKMHSCIFCAPMSFFDSTPSGRILNRASTDQSVVDLKMPMKVGAFAFSIIQLLGIIGQYYIPSARELARLGGVCKAPVIQHFAETMLGSITIRSFDQELRFKELSMKLIDGHSRPNFYTAAVMEWLCFRLDMLSSITFAFSLVFLISIPTGTIDPSIAGLAVTYGLNLNMLQAWVVWNLCNMENKMISVERILQYTSIPSEAPLVIEENRPDAQWPAHGEVVIQDLQALDKCQLGDEVRKKEGKLDSAVTENGENWSMGQRQLVCLGRVLLKKSKVLVLDEATASVDTATDNLIQQTLKQHFSDCTMLTIAHRITSVVDSNMVLLLDNGLIEEYDTPTKLLENKSSSFSKLVAEYSTRCIFVVVCVLFMWPSFDVVLADQVSIVIPLMKLKKSTKVVFYCHFPDLLLAQHTTILRQIYRKPIDFIEDVTTGMADLILVNSRFTTSTFAGTFKHLHARRIKPAMLYPAVNVEQFDKPHAFK
ncbi:hypothetical protein RHGRI_018748 [Rhododendron griersonianum]|uniref:ABC-type xenobiotic transporter n=1 Tax=Rhododendron griersonianum TaxID=479676 RepID=A0AAV6K2U8_9ERIC|nr:hypothetical protein RHGRI_018748 [Rhododendron griersonianum]